MTHQNVCLLVEKTDGSDRLRELDLSDKFLSNVPDLNQAIFGARYEQTPTL